MGNANYYSILSGTSAAAAGVFGKLSGWSMFQNYLIILRLIFFGLMVLCNGFVWTFYVKALQSTTSSLSVTVLTAAVNYFLSALFGNLIFGEVTTLLWWFGLSLVLLGVIFIARDQTETSRIEVIKSD